MCFQLFWKQFKYYLLPKYPQNDEVSEKMARSAKNFEFWMLKMLRMVKIVQPAPITGKYGEVPLKVKVPPKEWGVSAPHGVMWFSPPWGDVV